MVYSYYPSIDSIFVRIPKTGSRTIRRAFLPKGREEFDGEPFDCRFSFAFIRNPLHRFHSAYAMFKRKAEKKKGPKFDVSVEWILELLDDDTIRPGVDSWLEQVKLHTISLSHPYWHLDRMTRLCRFEYFKEEWEQLGGFLGVDTPEYYPDNSLTIPKAPLTDAERRMICNYFCEDFERFGYERPVGV